MGFSNGGHAMGAFFVDKNLGAMFQYYVFAEGGGEIKTPPPATAKVLLLLGQDSTGKGSHGDQNGKLSSIAGPWYSAFHPGKNLEAYVFPGGHSFSPKAQEQARKWLDEALGAAAKAPASGTAGLK